MTTVTDKQYWEAIKVVAAYLNQIIDEDQCDKDEADEYVAQCHTDISEEMLLPS